MTEPTLACVALHQDDRRVLGAQPYLDLGVTILRETGREIHSWVCLIE